MITSDPVADGLRQFAAFLLLLSTAIQKPDEELATLRQLMRQKRITIPKLAGMTGVTKGHLSRVLRGHRESKAVVLRCMCQLEKAAGIPLGNGK